MRSMALKVTIYRYFIIPNIVVAVMNIVANAFLIHALRRLKKLQNISHKFIAILSISDICIGTSLLLTEPAFWFLSNETHILVLTKCSGVLLYTFSQFSGLMILAIAVDRYIHMKYLVKYNLLMTNRRAVILVVFNIIATLLSSTIAVSGKMLNFGLASSLVPSLGLLGILFIQSVLYYRAYKSIRQRTGQLNLNSGMQPAIETVKKPNQEFCKSVLIILSSLWICYSPAALFTAMYNQEPDASWIMIGFFCALLLVYINSSLNALILISFNRQLKAFVLQQIRCYRPGTTETGLPA